MVPEANPERTAAFMRQSGLVRERLVPLSDALANLADWLMGICIEAGSTGMVHGEEGADEAEGISTISQILGEDRGDAGDAGERDSHILGETGEMVTTPSPEKESPEKESPEKKAE